jgi:hypothetical protein
MPRKIYEIAAEIRLEKDKIPYSAKPYLSAMNFISTPADLYGCEDGEGIVLRFLDNAQHWRGENARKLKKELKDILKGFSKRR